MAKVLFGLDIGTSTIKGVQISIEKEKRALLAAGYIATPTPTYQNPEGSDEDAVTRSVSRLVHDMKISTKDVVLSLPSAKVFSRVIETPVMNEKELESSLKWEVEPYIPLSLDRVKMDYVVLGIDQQNGRMKVFLVAAPIPLIDRYMKIATGAGLNPVAIETEMLADARSISSQFENNVNCIIVSIGASTSQIGLIHEKSLIYTKTFPIGGTTITRAIAEELGFEQAQAEEYKKTYGLDEGKLEGKIAKIILPLCSTLFSEIEKTILYFKQQYAAQEISLLILSGGTAKLQGFVLALTRKTGVNSQIHNPFTSLRVDPNVLSLVMPDAPIYTTAVGLATKEDA